MVQDKPESNALVLIEAPLVLLAAFLASMLFGFVALILTAAVVEDEGLGALLTSSSKLSIPLTATDPEQPPSLERTAELVREGLPGADVIVLPETKEEWSLTAWFKAEEPAGAVSVLAGGLRELGWESSESTLLTQPSLMAAMESPQRMKFYLPQLMIAQALCFVVAAWVLLRWRKPEPYTTVQTSRDYPPWLRKQPGRMICLFPANLPKYPWPRPLWPRCTRPGC